MDHAEAAPLLADYFAGRLDKARSRELQRHFKDCDACRLRISVVRAGKKGGLGGLDRAPAAPGIQEQMARNRDLLVKILLLMAFAFFVMKMRR